MASFKTTCPHCTTVAAGFTLTGQFLAETKVRTKIAYYVTTAICGVCEGGIIVEYQHQGGTQGLVKNTPMECPSDPSNFNWRVVDAYPQIEPQRVPTHTTEELQRYFTQASNALKRGDWDASGAMSRKVVDVSTKQKLGEGAKKYSTIKQRIDALAASNAITPDLQAWAHEIRLGGNDAAHEEDPYTEPEAVELLDFAELYLTYVYTMPGRLKERKEKAEADKRAEADKAGGGAKER